MSSLSCLGSFSADMSRAEQVYQALLDRGWRRSGTWLYYPVRNKTCCPCFTHRLDVAKFEPSKSQRKVARKFEAFLDGTLGTTASSGGRDLQKPSQHTNSCDKAKDTVDAAAAGTSEDAQHAKQAVEDAIRACHAAGSLPLMPAPRVGVAPPSKQHLKDAGIALTSPTAFAVGAAAARAGGGKQTPAAVARLLAAQIKLPGYHLEAEGGHLNFYSCSAPVSNPRITEPAGRSVSSATGAATESPSRANGGADCVTSSERAVDAGIDDLSDRHATQTPEAREQAGASTSGAGIPMAWEATGRRFEITMVRASASLVDVEFPLYKRYQIRQHGDPPDQVSRSGFKRFLIDSPFVSVEAADCEDAPPCGFGCFHQQYWVDGVLVAVGVVDILPSCLSSKYFFWDPDLAHLSLGKLSALKEIEWVRNASRTTPNLRYYYMGYYIHACSKVRYKVEFAPADLLCPETLAWVPFADVRARFEAEPRLARLAAACDGSDGAAESEPSKDGLPLSLLRLRLCFKSGLMLRLEDISTKRMPLAINWGTLERLRLYAGAAVMENLALRP